MAVLQMTRAEYEKKYGKSPVVTPVSKVDTTPAITQMTRAEYELKFGITPETKVGTGNPLLDSNPVIKAMGTNANAGKVPMAAFGNPIESLKSTASSVYDIFSAPKNEKLEAVLPGATGAKKVGEALSASAGGLMNAAADVVPGGKAALETIGKGFETAVNFAGNIHNSLADAAQKIGIMSPEQRKQYDKNNASFSDSSLGLALEAGASVLKGYGDVSNVMLLAHQTTTGVQKFIDKRSVPKDPPGGGGDSSPPSDGFKKLGVEGVDYNKISPSAQASMDAQRTNLVQQQANEIAAIESRYAKGRKANLYSKDEGASSRARIAETGVLKNSVDENGMVSTSHKGGAIDQYKAMTTKPAEGVVRANLVREGSKTNLSEVQAHLTEAVKASGLEGADLVSALNGVKREIAGLRIKADELGYVDNSLLHDAKINTTNNINYQTPPETATYRKAVARGYRTLVEKNSSFDVKGINAELAKYYEDIARLERLDGARVQGGRLGKYTAQITGTIAGGAIGGLFGGIGGMAVGTIVGGEVAGLIKGKAMSRAITEVPGKAPTSPILEKAVAQSKSEGNLNLSQSAKSTTAKTSIAKDTTTPKSIGQAKITDIAGFKRASGLSHEDILVETKAFNKILASEDKILADYKAEYGKVVNADDFRPFLKDIGYRGTNSAAVQEAVSYLAKRARTEALKNPGEYALGTAGGSGVGKTSAGNAIPEIKNLTDKAAMVLDSNFSSLESARTFIKEVRAAGKKFLGIFTYREALDALVNGIVKRALTNPKEMGRIVPNSVSSGNHIDSFSVVQQLVKDGEKFRFVDNSLGNGKAQVVSLDELINKVKYAPKAELKATFDAKIKELYENQTPFEDSKGEMHTLTKAQYESFIK